MKTNKALFLLIILLITIRTGFAQGIQQVEYPNLVKNGDFEDGPTGFKSDFINHPSNDVFVWGYYVITDNVAKYLAGGVFLNPVPNTGKYYAIDMNNSGKQRLWYDSVTVKPNTTYEFSCIAANCVIDWVAPGVMNFKVNGKKVCPSRTLSNGSSSWTPLGVHYKTGPAETRIEIAIVDEIWTLSGNDVALDNIVFREIPQEQYNSSCEIKFPPLAEKDKGVQKINDKVDKDQQAIVAKKIKDSVAAVVAIEEKKKADSIAVVAAIVEKKKAIEKKIKDSVAVVVAKQKEDSIAVAVVRQKADSVAAVVVAKQKADSAAAVAVVTKAKDPVVIKPKDPVIKIDPIKPKDPVVIKPKDPVVIKPKDPVVIKPKDPVVIKPKDPVVIKPKPPKEIKDMNDESIQVGVKLELSHIYFDQGKAHLQDASKTELDELVAFMKKFPHVRIRLEGHTTNDGNPQKCIILSEDRVKEVKKYLVAKGIADNRVEWIGYGGAKPLMNPDGTPGKKELNRRVEVEVIEK
jgi:outer membrane protein OmpA-like peptidoglycan-associated protein